MPITEYANEEVLPDDYPIYAGYAYVADGHFYISPLHGVTARQLKAREGIKELRRCNLIDRQKGRTITPHVRTGEAG